MFFFFFTITHRKMESDKAWIIRVTHGAATFSFHVSFNRRNRRATSNFAKLRAVSSSYGVLSGHPSKIANKRGRTSMKQGGMINLKEYEYWQCQQCGLGAYSTYMLRSGPGGDKTLCNFCGLHYAVHGRLPEDRKDLFKFTIDVEETISAAAAEAPIATAATSVVHSADVSAMASPMDATGTMPGTPAEATPAATPASF